MYCRLQSVIINLFRLFLYQCFIKILQFPAARINYQYNSLSKTLLRRGYVLLLLTETLILLGGLVMVFCSTRVTAFLIAFCLPCPQYATSTPDSVGSCPKVEELAWEKSVPTCGRIVGTFGTCVCIPVPLSKPSTAKSLQKNKFSLKTSLQDDRSMIHFQT